MAVRALKAIVALCLVALGAEAGAQSVTWTDIVGATNSSGTLTKAGSSDAWDASAIGRHALTGIGYMECTVQETATERSCGFARTVWTRTPSDLTYGFVLGADGHLYIYEKGILKQEVGGYATADILRVTLTSTGATFSRNGTEVATSSIVPTYPVYALASLKTPGATVTGVTVSGTQVERVVWTRTVKTNSVGSSVWYSRTAITNAWDAGATRPGVSARPDTSSSLRVRR